MKKSYLVDASDTDMRIDRWVRTKIGKLPQSLIEKNLRVGKIKINDRKIKNSHKLKLNDKIDIYDISFEERNQKKINKYIPSKKFLKSNEELIIENNQDFIIINKKAGVSVQGGTKSKKNLIDIFTKSEIFNDSKPLTVHRLDKDTSGILIIAKHRKSAQLLTSLFRLRKVYKTYIAICHGEIDKDKGIWNDPLVRYEKNKKIIEKAETIYNVIDKNVNSTLVKMKPITGRKHQLRKQLYNINHPVLGDDKYTFFSTKKSINKDLMLHAYNIKFMINGVKYNYTAPLPEYFEKMIKTKRLKFQNF
ncbi:MAG: RNA pseudouridine synthase [Candidatus Pelagibacter sp. TMED275]|nr:MAG: RNA pseudouridine synthase [Candidatus Pelagibacter sp. TMED275]|tara:strand:- start:118 stop:1032 length:915 start_codon:yes stop_codon:yes gene_type:complete